MSRILYSLRALSVGAVIAIALTGNAAAQEAGTPNETKVLATDTSVEGLTRHTVDVLRNSAAILGDTSEIRDQAKVEEIATEQESYFKGLLQSATSYSADAMNAAAAHYGLQPANKQDGVNIARGDTGVRYRLFVSMAMGPAALKQAMQYGIKYDHSMVLSLRGPLPGEKLDPMVFRMMDMIGGVKEGMKIPNIEINPPAFTDSGVATVPSLVALDEEGKVIAKASGVMDPEWIESEIRAGHTGDLGVHGATVEIAEIDLLEAIIAKAKAADPRAIAEKARREMWKKVPLIPLPAATEKRLREMDAGFTVTQDIPLPDGTYLARKGDYFNPLDNPELDFHEVIVVIDATKQDQVKFALALNRVLKDRGMIVLLSDIDREKAWPTFAVLTHRLGNQPFLLTNDVQERFRIEKVPTVITVVDKKIEIQELPTSLMEGNQ
ncbi:TrbC family F-type conjugative pilus assembly protein (plasmid) [Xanthomonas sontii]|uniref:TrbC family F-type conjugative pilus assembly protein n=1 Tax=Xanthomonas sontii TaxID=2650745 RepID=UPI003F84F0C2